jgi:hypothetical protein
MTDFGRYRLTFTPSELDEGSIGSEVEMTISAEANLREMLIFFESFLKAVGYQIDGKELSLERSAPDFGDQSFWEDDGVSIVGNPWGVTYGSSDLGIAYIGSGLQGAMGEDHLSFSPVRSGFGNSVVTFS